MSVFMKKRIRTGTKTELRLLVRLSVLPNHNFRLLVNLVLDPYAIRYFGFGTGTITLKAILFIPLINYDFIQVQTLCFISFLYATYTPPPNLLLKDQN